jgi:hypothetical protein
MPISLVRHFIALVALAAAALTLAVAPSIASAQPLSSVAISPDHSNGYLVLDVEGASTALGAKVISFVGTGGSNQRWTLSYRADGEQQIVNNRRGLCLTTNGIAGSQLYQWTCNGGSRQVWSGDLPTVTHVGSALQNPSTGLVVDVEGASPWPGARVVGWAANGGLNQKFAYYQLY